MKKIRYHLFSVLLASVFVIPVVVAQGYEEGRTAYINGDYKTAFGILKPLADAGDAEAQKMMGIMYDYGHGVASNPAEALQWYIRSAEQGQTAVQYQVGAKYFKGENIARNYTEAARWWAMAADGGQVDAQFNLGLMYFRGLGIAQEDARAADLFRRAADQGHAHAQYSLAVMYAFGRGLDKDYDTALQWFLKSADQGVAQAQYNLGIFYENGYAVEADVQRAKEWYSRAATQGLEEARAKLLALDAGSPAVATAGAEDTPAVPVAVSSPAPAATIDATISEEPAVLASTQPSPTNTNYPISEIATNAIKREDWVLQQKPDSYTLQIGSVTEEDDLVRFLQGHGIEDNSAYIQVVIEGTTRYNAFYGVYATYAEAEQAVAGLPDSLRQISPWIRNFGILQKMLN
jgi:TPR repeat protein